MSRNRKSIIGRHLGMENLEGRAVPAGLVTAQLLLDGTLLITGDDNNNRIEVVDDQGEIEVRGVGTAVNGVAEVEFDDDAVARIEIRLGAGNDRAHLDGLEVLGGITVVDDLGNDRYSADDLEMSGTTLSIETGVGNDEVALEDSAVGGFFVATGAGGDEVEVDYSLINVALIDTNGGNDEVDIFESSFGSLVANTGGGEDEIYLEDVIASNLAVDAGGGSDLVATDDVVALTTGLINGGAGSDLLDRDGDNLFVSFNFEGFI